MIGYYHFEYLDENRRPPVGTPYINEERGVADVVSGHSVAEGEVKNVSDSVPQSWIWKK